MTPVQKTATSLAAVVALMVGLSFAAVPFYNWFCRVTGFAGTTSVAEKPSDVILDQTVTVRFDASLDRDMPWTFKPMQRKMDIRIGETGLAFYEAYNPTNHVVAGQASYNVTPDQAGGYFTKIACFCFTMQVLQPGERAIMPVTFYVDPDIVNDPEAQYIHEITLSYTFHEAEVPVDKQAGLAATAANPLN